MDVTRTIHYESDDGHPRVRYEGEWIGYVLKGDLPVRLSGDKIDQVVAPTKAGQRITFDTRQTVRPKVGMQT